MSGIWRCGHCCSHKCEKVYSHALKGTGFTMLNIIFSDFFLAFLAHSFFFSNEVQFQLNGAVLSMKDQYITTFL